MVSSTVKLYGRLNLLCLHGQKWTDSIWTRREESCHCHLCRVRHSCLNLRLGRKSFPMGPALTFCSQMVAPLLWTLFPKGSGISTRAIHHTGTRPLIMELLEDSVDEHLPSSFLFFVFFHLVAKTAPGPLEHTSSSAALLGGQRSSEGVRRLRTSRDTFVEVTFTHSSLWTHKSVVASYYRRVRGGSVINVTGAPASTGDNDKTMVNPPPTPPKKQSFLSLKN